MTLDLAISDWQSLSVTDRLRLLQRPAVDDDQSRTATVRKIISKVRDGGDRALKALTARYDGAALADLRVSDGELAAAERTLGAASLAAIDTAIANVRRFHEAQLPGAIDIETMPGVRCERMPRAIDSVGLYVPAGTAPLPSAAIMLLVPAGIAGCRQRVVCIPPRKDGSADPAALVAAGRAGATEIFKIGGAQAIAAMAFGTESVPRVSKIFGPGNAWVTEAKVQVSSQSGGVAIDMPAGPSEVLVIADAGANPVFVAADLLSQAEHGRDSQVVLLTTARTLAESVRDQIGIQLKHLQRHDIATEALSVSRLIVCESIEQALEISNDYAPEHLILQIDDARQYLPAVRNAGSVFIGPYTPESVGDYCSGTNHVLPTYGAARSYSGLGVEQFMRQMTVQELSQDGLKRLAPTVIELARLEGLDAHAAAVTLRLQAVAEMQS